MQRPSGRLMSEYRCLDSKFHPRSLVLCDDSRCLHHPDHYTYVAEWAIHLDNENVSWLTADSWNRSSSRKQSIIYMLDNSLITNNLLVEIRNHPRLEPVGNLVFKGVTIHLHAESEEYKTKRRPHRIFIQGKGYHSTVEFEESDFKTEIISTPIMDDLIGILMDRL